MLLPGRDSMPLFRHYEARLPTYSKDEVFMTDSTRPISPGSPQFCPPLHYDVRSELLSAFEYLCECYGSKSPLPAGVTGAYFESSTEEILDAVAHLHLPMDDPVCEWLGLPTGSCYAEGAATLMGGPNFTEEDLQRIGTRRLD